MRVWAHQQCCPAGKLFTALTSYGNTSHCAPIYLCLYVCKRHLSSRLGAPPDQSLCVGLIADPGVGHRQHDISAVSVYILWADEAAVNLCHWLPYCVSKPAAVWHLRHLAESVAKVGCIVLFCNTATGTQQLESVWLLFVSSICPLQTCKSGSDKCNLGYLVELALAASSACVTHPSSLLNRELHM